MYEKLVNDTVIESNSLSCLKNDINRNYAEWLQINFLKDIDEAVKMIENPCEEEKAFAIPILNKKPDSVLEAYEKIIGDKPIIVLEHDDGKEYLGDFLRFIKENNLINITIETGNHKSLGIINRFKKQI